MILSVSAFSLRENRGCVPCFHRGYRDYGRRVSADDIRRPDDGKTRPLWVPGGSGRGRRTELARAAGRLAGNGSGFGLMPSGCVLDPQKERLPAIFDNGRQPCYADAYLAKSRYKSLYCFAEFSQDTSLSISRCTISSQHQRFSK